MECYLAKVTQLANNRISTKNQTAAIPNLMIFLRFQKKLISEEINLKKKTLEGNISSVALEAQKGKPQDGELLCLWFYPQQQSIS